MIDPKEIEETLGEQSEGYREFVADQGKDKQPEAPASVTIKGYFKGFSVLITNRDPAVAVAPLLAKAINGINWMAENGFKPSWNEDTNVKVNGKSGMQKFDDDQAKQDACSHIDIKFVQSQTDKNPGRWFKSCKDCGKFLGWQDDNK